MDKAKVIIAICILIAGLFGYAIGKHFTSISPTNNATQLNLPAEQIKASGIDSTKQKQVEDFIDKFYDYQYQRNIDALLALFSPPSNNQEQDDLDFLLGKDYAQGDEKPLPRLFSTQGYGFRVVAYYVRAITTQNATTKVLVDEMRVMYSGGEYVGFSTNIANLTLEIEQTKTEQKVVNYNHTNTSNAGKYEGLNGY